MVSDEVAKVITDANSEFAHGFTYSGHPAACAVAIENIRIMQQENIVSRVRDEVAPYLAQRWQELAEHPLVGEARSKGMVAALELVADKQTKQRFAKEVNAGEVCRDICINNGLIMRACGQTMIISPPLVITKQQVDQLVTLAKQSLDDTLQALS
jgi:putrescine aminotransferase